ncbi:MAG: AcrB/AcrD/AcrF family protein, partial [Novosphingobium sp.]|nr:AcrB/AcrD/AcrF family protein [Novosphingobium sp.]
MNLGERRRPAMTRDLVVRAGLIWLAVSVIFVITRWQGIAAMALPDADDTLRMVQVRDLLAGQHFWDLHQYRVDPPQGVLMHWSRLVDLP